jgi:hypothetical protein
VKKSIFTPANLDEVVERVVSVLAPNIRESLVEVGEDDYEPMKALIENSVFSDDGLGKAIEALMESANVGGFDVEDKEKYAGFPVFLGKAIAYALINSDKLFSNELLPSVQETVNRSIEDYVSAFIKSELVELSEIEMENSNG